MSLEPIDETPHVDLVDDSDVELTQDVNKPHPSFLIAMVATVLTIKQDQPDASTEEALYLTIKDYLKATGQLNKPEDATNVVFAYYLEAYRTYHSIDPTNSGEPIDPKLHNKAALSLFDLYKLRPHDGLVRRLLIQSVVSMHNVACVHQMRENESSGQEVMSYLTSIALLAQSLPVFVRGIRRKRNYAYVEWLKTFFERVLATDDLSFIKDDETLKSVLKQITSQKNTVTI